MELGPRELVYRLGDVVYARGKSPGTVKEQSCALCLDPILSMDGHKILWIRIRDRPGTYGVPKRICNSCNLDNQLGIQSLLSEYKKSLIRK